MEFAWLTDPLLHRFWWRALVIAIALGSAGACLGSVLVARRLSLLGDGLSHALLPGVGLAWLVVGPSLPAMMLGAAVAGTLALLGAWLLVRLTRIEEDAASACLMATSFAAGVLIVSRIRSPTDLSHILFGNLLAVGPGDLYLAVAVAIVVAWTFALTWRAILVHAFDPGFLRLAAPAGGLVHPILLVLLVIDLAASLRAMGAVTAVGLLLIPASSAALWCATLGRRIVLAGALAGAGSALGLWLAWHWDLPPGPAVVATLGLGFLISALIGQRGGLLALRRHAPHLHRDHGHDSGSPDRLRADDHRHD